jgi:RNA-dependent RNA polymerase
LTQADLQEGGVFSDSCLQLAELHSLAVDYAKNGIPASMPVVLKAPDKRPDFFGLNAKNSYKSTGVLGKMYRAAKSMPESHDVKPEYDSDRGGGFDAVIASLERSGNEDWKREAKTLLLSYNLEILRLMSRLGIETEGEVVSGQVLSYSVRHEQVRGTRAYFTMTARLNRATGVLRERYRDIFFSDVKDSVDCAVQKAAIWYCACARQAKIDEQNGTQPFLSFPWVVNDVLCDIARSQIAATG